MKRFCPKCGSETGPFIKGFCQKCFLKDNPVVELPEKLEVEHCRRCNRVRLRGKWLGQDEQALKGFIESKVKTRELEQPKIFISLHPQAAGEAVARATVNGLIDSSPVTIEREILLKPLSGICDSCMKLSSRYYEAVLQLRYREKPPDAEFASALSDVQGLLSAMRPGNALAGIVDIEKKTKGFDFLIGSKRAAKAAAEEFAKKQGSEITRSFKVTGVDRSGKQKKRYTFCVRMKGE